MTHDYYCCFVATGNALHCSFGQLFSFLGVAVLPKVCRFAEKAFAVKMATGLRFDGASRLHFSGFRVGPPP